MQRCSSTPVNADNEGLARAVGCRDVMDGRDVDVVSGVQRSRHFARSLSDIHLHPLTPAGYLLPEASLKHAARHPDMPRIIRAITFFHSNNLEKSKLDLRGCPR